MAYHSNLTRSAKRHIRRSINRAKQRAHEQLLFEAINKLLIPCQICNAHVPTYPFYIPINAYSHNNKFISKQGVNNYVWSIIDSQLPVKEPFTHNDKEWTERWELYEKLNKQLAIYKNEFVFKSPKNIYGEEHDLIYFPNICENCMHDSADLFPNALVDFTYNPNASIINIIRKHIAEQRRVLIFNQPDLCYNVMLTFISKQHYFSKLPLDILRNYIVPYTFLDIKICDAHNDNIYSPLISGIRTNVIVTYRPGSFDCVEELTLCDKCLKYITSNRLYNYKFDEYIYQFPK